MEVRHLKPMFDLGQLGLMPYSPRDEASIEDTICNSDVVINMIGKHYETKHIVPTRREDGNLCRINYSFEETHVEIPRRIARLAKKNGVKTFIHVSALAADLESSSKWSQSKARGELAVREEFPEAIIVKAVKIFFFFVFLSGVIIKFYLSEKAQKLKINIKLNIQILI